MRRLSLSDRYAEYLKQGGGAPEKKRSPNRKFYVMFAAMLAMLMLFSAIVGRTVPRALVAVDAGRSEGTVSAFTVRNLGAGEISFTATYELWRLGQDGRSLVSRVAASPADPAIAGLGEREFLHDSLELLPMFEEALGFPVVPGSYSVAMLYLFTDSRQEHAINILGNVFEIRQDN